MFAYLASIGVDRELDGPPTTQQALQLPIGMPWPPSTDGPTAQEVVGAGTKLFERILGMPAPWRIHRLALPSATCHRVPKPAVDDIPQAGERVGRPRRGRMLGDGHVDYAPAFVREDHQANSRRTSRSAPRRNPRPSTGHVLVKNVRQLYSTAGARAAEIVRRVLLDVGVGSRATPTSQSTFAVMPSAQTRPALLIARKTRPCVRPAPRVQASTAVFTHAGIGTVRMWPPFPTKSAMTQCSSRCRRDSNEPRVRSFA